MSDSVTVIHSFSRTSFVSSTDETERVAVGNPVLFWGGLIRRRESPPPRDSAASVEEHRDIVFSGSRVATFDLGPAAFSLARYRETATHTLRKSVRDEAKRQMLAASGPPEVVEVLISLSLKQTAKQVVRIADLHRDDPALPVVDLDSLTRLLLVVIDNQHWAEPELSLSDEGYVEAEWPTEEDGRVSMTFVPSGRMDYVATSAPALSGEQPALNIGGHHIEGEALDNLRWFTERIVRR